jgi:hypothetical protein
MANEPRNLYDYVEYFRLQISGIWKYIDEPINWDKLTIKLVRDDDLYGLNYEFIDDKITLIFPAGEGFEEIENEYGINGSDGKMVFEFGYNQGGSKKRQFAGTINFNSYKRTYEGIEVNIEKTAFDSLLRTRSETKVSLIQDKTFDGAPIVPPTPMKIKLHSKKLIKLGRAQQPEGEKTDYTSPTGWAGFGGYIQPDTSAITVSEVEDLQSMPLAVTNVTAHSELRFQYISKESGTARFKWFADYDLQIQGLPISGGPINAWSLVPVVEVWNGATWKGTYSPFASLSSGTTPSMNLSVHHNFTIDLVLDLLANDEVYFNININISNGNSHIYTVNGFTGFIELSQETIAPPSFCYGYRVIDLLNFTAQCLTGKANVIKSPFFEPTGCGYRYILTNGYQVRNFDTLAKPLQIAWKEMIEGLSPIWNMALQFFTQGDEDKILFDLFDAIFKSNRIYTFDEVSSYEEDHAQDITFNEVETGYTKYAEGDLNTLDEFNTTGTWLLPIKSYKKKFSRKSGLITSGYLIEKMRREQFKANPSTSLAEDDNLFLISIVEGESIYENMNFSINSVGMVDFGKPIGMSPGDKFFIVKSGGGPNDAILFTVVLKDSSGPEKYRITPAPTTDAGIGTFRLQLTDPQAERNEAFDVVDNLISPETAYNLRLTPLQILYNSATYINSCLVKKAGTELITNTFYKSNGLLKTRYASGATCKMRDANVDMQENAPFPLSALQTRRRAFLPETVTFKAPLSYRDLISIKESYRGEKANPADNYGVVAFPDLDGQMWEGYIWSLENIPTYQECTIIVRKKRKL